ncbi:unnamed protein product, partial [Closterium sp. NIES-65]
MSPFPLLPPWPLPPKLPQYTLSLRRRVSAPPPCRAPPLPRAVLPRATIIVPRAVSLPRRRGFCARCANERAGRVPPVVPASAHERTPRRYVPPMSARSLRPSACCFSPSPALPFLPFLFPLSPSPLYPFSCRPSLLSPPVPISPPSPRYNHTNQVEQEKQLGRCDCMVGSFQGQQGPPWAAMKSRKERYCAPWHGCAVLLAFLLLLTLSPRLPLATITPTRVEQAERCDWWSKWSDVTVWGAAFKGSRDPPGVRSRAGRNVTVPCGMAVLLDVANVTLDTLHVHGWLKVLDNKPRLPRIEVRANFIIVTGRLTVGEKDKQFAAQALFTLTPNSGRQRREYAFTLFPPAEPAFPRPLGHKVFAVVGGQVDLHGLPGPPSMPVWVRLNKTAIAGQKEIVVNADVSTWPVGGEIAIASTSAKMDEAEKAVIAGVSPHPQGYRILLSGPLKYSHDGNPKAVLDGFGGAVDVRGEVGLLHRNIVIHGVHETGKYELEGGHFMVFMTQTPQFIEGVQFAYMGQQGVLGRYPLHFHVCGEANQSHVVRKNAIVYSKQRCVVIHATSNMTIEDTVTYESKGHCFLVEEGSENNNVFRRNLGISVRKVKVVIPSKESYDKHTDDKPSTFWMANPNNDYIDNVAAGSEDSGYWTELKEGMRGLSQLLPNARNMHPIETKFGTYSGNVAHSAKFGFRSYPHGMFPYAPGARVTLSNFLIYRNEVG